MPARKPLEVHWSRRAERDLDRIDDYYLKEGGERLADKAVDAVYWHVQHIAELHLRFRAGKLNTRECVMQHWPFTIVYRLAGGVLTVVRVVD